MKTPIKKSLKSVDAISPKSQNLQEKTSLPPFFDLLDAQTLQTLQGKKNLLAFSAGVDSTALFFLLLEKEIDFDIAIVDYNLRKSAKAEVSHAQMLAQRHQKVCYHDSVHLNTNNFEHEARTHRYNFFEDIIQTQYYDNLLTAHQLNDRLEWFLMQLSRGAGLVEMMGFDAIESRDFYHLVRPLLYTDKATLKDYLTQHKHLYFEDESNLDMHYARNQMRHRFSNDFLKDFKKGVTQSFHYLQEDKQNLFQDTTLYHDKKLSILKRSHHESRSIDRVCKTMGYLLSAKQKKELQAQKSSVIGDKIVVEITQKLIWIAPFVKEPMDKVFKERCRRQKIPAKIRPYLQKEQIDLRDLPLD
jgi:tRNA(Ile)-lysidine synthase